MIEGKSISPIFYISKWWQFPYLKWQHLLGSMLAHSSQRLSEFSQFLSTSVTVSTPMLSQSNFLTVDQSSRVWLPKDFRDLLGNVFNVFLDLQCGVILGHMARISGLQCRIILMSL